MGERGEGTVSLVVSVSMVDRRKRRRKTEVNRKSIDRRRGGDGQA